MIEFFTDLGGAIMTPLYWVTSLVLTGFHDFFSLFLDPDSGLAWVLSIVGLTLVIRAALIPLFVKQIKSSRNMQMLQPRVRELQKKYGHDREKLAQETMALYRETGTNPFASCMPILLQMPIFLSLFRLIDRAAHGEQRGVLSLAQVESLRDATLFGAKISQTFLSASGEHQLQVRILAAFLVAAMTATTFLTQRQLMSKNMPADALQGPYAQQQKMLLYVLPVVFAVGGVAFPIGVLVYWTTSNLWTMGQQFYVIRNNPAPGTPAFEAKVARDKAKAQKHGKAPESEVAAEDEVAAPESRPAPQRQQPKSQSRSQRKRQGAKGAKASGTPAQPLAGSGGQPGGEPSAGPSGSSDGQAGGQGNTGGKTKGSTGGNTRPDPKGTRKGSSKGSGKGSSKDGRKPTGARGAQPGDGAAGKAP